MTATRRVLWAWVAGLALCLGGCGGFDTEDVSEGVGEPGGSGSPGLGSLTIVTQSIPAGSEGAGYGEALQTYGERGPVVWTVTSGELPTGVTLSDDGMVQGTPADTGFYTFTVSATDGVATDYQPLALSVDAFGAFVTDGLRFGDAWSAAPVSIQTVGHAGSVAFEVVATESGGALVNTHADLGTATYLPGDVPVQGGIDTIRVTDTASGRTAEVTLTVRPNPLENHVARWGLTDVWYVDLNRKFGSHPYASDFHAALVAMGLRNPASVDTMGTEADQLAETVVRVMLHRHLNTHFHRDTDGSAGVAGMAISFAYDEPGATYVKPAPGSWLNANAGVYSVIAVVDNATPGFLGAAFVDSPSNDLHENNTPSAAGMLGVFVNRVTSKVQIGYNAYGTTLVADPVNASDVDALKALLFEGPNPGGRYHVLEYKMRGLARSLAAVTAHEIAHSLGLGHTVPAVFGSIMNAGTAIAPSNTYEFLPQDAAALRLALPGPSRLWAQAAAKATGMPEGGACVCHLGGDDE